MPLPYEEVWCKGLALGQAVRSIPGRIIVSFPTGWEPLWTAERQKKRTSGGWKTRARGRALSTLSHRERSRRGRNATAVLVGNSSDALPQGKPFAHNFCGWCRHRCRRELEEELVEWDEWPKSGAGPAGFWSNLVNFFQVVPWFNTP